MARKLPVRHQAIGRALADISDVPTPLPTALDADALVTGSGAPETPLPLAFSELEICGAAELDDSTLALVVGSGAPYFSLPLELSPPENPGTLQLARSAHALVTGSGAPTNPPPLDVSSLHPGTLQLARSALGGATTAQKIVVVSNL